MTKTLTGLFDRYEDAKRAVNDLEAAGVPHRDISIVANNVDGKRVAGNDAGDAAAQDAGTGASLGAAVGGAGGLLAGLGLLAIPGLGPVVAAGWLASTAVGAVGGAVVGGAACGLIGGLTHAGVSEDDAHVYAEVVRRGGTLVTAKVDDALVTFATPILRDDRAVDVSSRRSDYEKDGWTRFDDTAPEYTADQVRAERARYDRV